MRESKQRGMSGRSLATAGGPRGGARLSGHWPRAVLERLEQVGVRDVLERQARRVERFVGIRKTRDLRSKGSVPTQVEPPPPELDLPWRECYDENYRRTYFFNVVSGESRWRAPPEEYVPYERPAAAPDRAVSVDAAALAAAEARFGAAAAAERPASVAL